MREIGKIERTPKPDWLKAGIPAGGRLFKLKRELESRDLHTICQSARCPNINECWNQCHATFLIMGAACSRNCLFCSVPHGSGEPLNPDEAKKIVEMVDIMGLKYIVITSVSRDDLEDGGSSHFAAVIKEIKESRPGLRVEALVPDFKGSLAHLDRVLEEQPDVLAHNLETVRGLYPRVNRESANYERSLRLLEHAKERHFITKSGIMVGLGETEAEIEALFADLRKSGTDLLTIGQYLQPTKKNLPVEKFYTPAEFARLKGLALSFGFCAVESGPFVRSSFGARAMYYECRRRIQHDDLSNIIEPGLEYPIKKHYTYHLKKMKQETDKAVHEVSNI